jgi:predicted DCC family thiol-disulfide oxidoreductase YuxK
MSTEVTAALADLEKHPVLLFDGVCNLCQGTVRFLLERDRDARLRFAPLQSAFGRALLADFALDPDVLDNVVLVDPDGAHARSEAMLRCARLLGAPWSWSALLRVIPRPLRDAVYDFIARHRYRWFGKKDACPMPQPEWRDRFLA